MSSSSSSVSFQRSNTRIPAGVLPPVSAAITIGNVGARGAGRVRRAERLADGVAAVEDRDIE